jgi:cytosine deaminase
MDEFMRAAIEEARKGLDEGGIPIGSVLVKDGQIIGRGRNKRVQEGNPILHAETDCLKNVGRIGSYAGTTLYSTLMPCFFCAGAVVQFGIKKVVVGETGDFTDSMDFMQSHGVEITDLAVEECKVMMKDFSQKHPELWKEDCGNL